MSRPLDCLASGVEEPAENITHHIDQPAAWAQLPRCVIIRGWCYATTGQSITGIRLRAADRVLTGVVGLPRPDVKAALPAAPDDNTGFEIRGTLPVGRVTLTIEARLADGSWQQLLTRTVAIKGQLIPPWLGNVSLTELMPLQMPTQMAYPARAIQVEKLPPI